MNVGLYAISGDCSPPSQSLYLCLVSKICEWLEALVTYRVHGKVQLHGSEMSENRNLLVQWFDKYLKDMDTGTENIPPVVQHVLNYPTRSTPEEFRNDNFATTTEWPHPAAQPERWYLRGDMRLTRQPPQDIETMHTMSNPNAQNLDVGKSKGGGLLVAKLTLNDGSKCSQSYDQWTLGVAGLITPKLCFWNDARLQTENLSYETTPMNEDYYINGPLQADIFIDSTASEAVLSVRIEDVSRNGKQVTPITNGLLLASVRAASAWGCRQNAGGNFSFQCNHTQGQ